VPVHALAMQANEMTTFVYSRRGSTAFPRVDEIPATLPNDGSQVRYLSDNDDGVGGENEQHPRLKALLRTIEKRDTLIVNRLDDLGNDAQEIGAAISLLSARFVRVFVFQIGALDLASPSGRFVRNTLDALAEIEHHHSKAASQPALSSRVSRRRADVPETLRSKIVTDYSVGESISALARRYKLPRSAVAKVVFPAQPNEPSFPLAFGD
jgi:putative DNA-invertase from lambdoid prophage Rac